VETADLKLDGNAVAGLLQEIFAVEATTIETTCGGCGAVEAVGALTVYLHAPGIVIRCRHCDRALIRIVRRGARYCVDLDGARRLGTSGRS